MRNCIEGGARLAGAALLVGPPPTTIVSLLPTVAQAGGCGDVVDFSKSKRWPIARVRFDIPMTGGCRKRLR